MKKLIAIILLSLMLLPLVCCAGKIQPPAGEPAQPGASQKPTDPTAPGPAGTETAEPTGNETPGPEEPSVLPYRMHEPPLTYEEVYDPDTDYNNFYDRIMAALMETEDAYIFSGGQYLYYYDKTIGEGDVLCPKPECMHDYIRQNKECNAFVGSSRYAICMYIGQIYFTQVNGQVIELYRMNPDTSGREKLFTLEFGEGKTYDPNYAPQYAAVHRGKLYGWNVTHYVEAGEPKVHRYITCWDLETGEYEVIYEEEGGGLPYTFFFGDYVYIAVSDWLTEDTEDYETIYIEQTIKVLRYDTKTGKTETVLDTVSEDAPDIMTQTLYVASEDRVYITGYGEGDVQTIFNVANGELEEVLSFSFPGMISLFPDYIVAAGRRYDGTGDRDTRPVQIGIWDYEGNELFNGKVPLDDIFALEENLDKSSVGPFGIVANEGAFFIGYGMKLDVEVQDYERERTDMCCLVRYELSDGELIGTVLCVDNWE